MAQDFLYGGDGNALVAQKRGTGMSSNVESYPCPYPQFLLQFCQLPVHGSVVPYMSEPLYRSIPIKNFQRFPLENEM